MDQRQTSYYLRRVYRLLKSDNVPIVFKRMRGRAGFTDHKIILLNQDDAILPTLVHECLHVLYSHWSEAKVCQYEKQIFNQLTPRQIKRLLLLLTLATNKIDLE